MIEPQVILVDNQDKQIGTLGKLEAHQKGILHRAISVFIINSRGDWVLQRRALDKYHSKGLWTNTCCSHPYPGESNPDAAKRRLMEEMGLDSDLTELFTFTYKEKLENNLTEHEFDYIFLGITDNQPIINVNEVLEWKQIGYKELDEDIKKNPNNYTYWFKEIYTRVFESIHLKSTE
jgi:isopentenyl-diphosphate Delta-isomerase